MSSAPCPGWRGPYHNGTAVDAEIELVEDLSQAKLVWKREGPIPGTYPRAGGVNYWTGGYGVPVVAEGRVYLTR